jgi:uncharacterized membrane protein YtjA (UPF0391 family)
MVLETKAAESRLDVSYPKGSTLMLRWALVFAVLALVAGVLGLGGLAGDFSYIARILLFVFVVLFVVSLILGRRGSAPI